MAHDNRPRPVYQTSPERQGRLTRAWWRLVRFGFRLLYNEMAWSYDVVSWLVSLGQWRAWQRAALPYLTGRQVLEIAHGPGHMLSLLGQAGYEVVGGDLSPAMGRQARRRLRRQGLPAPLVRCRAQALPFAASRFESVLATFPTDFIADPATLAEIARCLRPEGQLVIVPEGHLLGAGWLIRFIHWLFKITGQRLPDEPESLRSPVQLTPAWERFRRALAAAGFDLAIHPVVLKRSGCTVLVAIRDVNQP